MLANEKLRLYKEMRDNGLGEAAAVSLVSGAVVTLPPSNKARREEEQLLSLEMAAEQTERALRRQGEESPFQGPPTEGGTQP